MRYPLVIANWKLHGSKHMVKNLIAALRKKLGSVSGCNLAIAPPVLYLNLAKKYLSGSRIALGAQNVDTHLVGAYTGEVSAAMLKDIGAQYIIIGHSERRIFHQEKNEYIAEKFAVLKECGLIPVLCIGESAAENKAGKTKTVCTCQIDVVLNHLGIKSFENSVIAYEPIWAIGTGNSASPEQVQTVHKFIRNHIKKHDMLVAQKVMLLYGGSVNTGNAAELFNQPDIDGALVGGASLTADSFALIVTAAAQAKQNKIHQSAPCPR